MKKILLFVLSLGLTAAMFSGCFMVDPPATSSSAGGAQSSSSVGGGQSSSSLQEESSSNPVRTFTLVFRQEGKADIIRYVNEGEALSNIPTPAQKVGYTVTWEITDFSNVTQDLTIKTVETPNTYTITYDAGEGTPSVATQTVTYDKAPESFATATRDGYQLVCWKYEGKAILATELWKIPSDVTLIAEWVPTVKYTVSFVQDGCETITITATSGGSISEADIPTPKDKVGYTVVWEQIDLTNITKNITVNAVATANTYTITYDANDGTASAETQKVTYDKAPGSFATAMRDGYTFLTWAYEGVAVLPTEIWKIASDVTLVAQWLPVQTYMVSFVQNGCETITITATEGGSISEADIPTPKDKVGYTVTWEEKDLTNIGENITVNAVATPNVYTITYDANGGTASAETQKVTYDKAPESFATATRKGYKFVCWKYEGKAVLATELWKIPTDVTLVAEWAPLATYTVSFVQAGEETIFVSVEEGSSLSAADIPTPKDKVGYTVTWEEKDLTNVIGNITVNAVATPNAYTITYDANGGTASKQQQQVTYNTAPQSFATATREGYQFKGWVYEGKVLSETALWTIDSDVTLTAVWAKIYTIIFDLDGGVMETTTITVVEGETYSLPTPSKIGFAFSGWSYGSQKVTINGVWSLSADEDTLTLKANWLAKEWTNDY